MSHLKILNSREKKQILETLESQYGFKEKLDYVFLINKKNKLFIATPDIEKIDFDHMRVNLFGIYFGEQYRDHIRLSIEGSQIIGPYATKNVIELTESQLHLWVQGLDINYAKEIHDGFVIIANNKNYFASGKTKEGTLFNYLPKARALKVVNV